MGCAVLLDCPDEFREEAKYTFDQILTILGINHSFIENVGDLAEGQVLIAYTQENSRKWLEQAISSAPVLTLPVSPEPFNLRDELSRNPPGTSFGEETTAVGFDLVKIAFHLLSRQEELRDPSRDRFGRFPASQSTIYRQGLLRRPILNEYLIDLLDLLRRSRSPLLRKDFWPPGSSFAVSLSHDVDFKRKWGFRRILLEGRKALSSANRLGGLRRLLGSVASASREDAYWNIEGLIDIERRFGFRSSFLFSSARTAKWDPTYSLSEAKISEALRRVRREGFEVALHASFDSFARPLGVLSERRKLEKAVGMEVAGNRFHYLRFGVRTSWRAEEEAGLSYDMTLGYPDKIGFRAGVAFPYNPYDPETGGGLTMLELPLGVSDGALLGEKEPDPEKAVVSLLSRVKDTSGLVSLLWHPHTLDGEDFPSLRGVYPAILEWIDRNGGFATSGREICNWWRRRRGLRLVEETAHSWTLLPEDDLGAIGLELIGPGPAAVRVEGARLEGRYKTPHGCHLELAGLSGGEEIVVSSVQ